MTELLTLRALAMRLGWPADRIRRLAKTGRMPAVRIGRYYFFAPADVDAWIAAHVVTPAPAKPTPAERDWTAEAGAFAGTFR